jgi:hypothetical protein
MRILSRNREYVRRALVERWMNALIPGKKRFTSKNQKGEIILDRVAKGLDWKAKVVCERCNNTWMSKIERKHAKPSMADLITGKLDIPIPRSRANSIALFCFKTAVVLDHLARNREPFFKRSCRHNFRTSLAIPPNVGMWMAGFGPFGKGEIHTGYFDGAASDTLQLKTYVCTYAVGHFVFQVAGYILHGFTWITPKSRDFNDLAVPFWPTIPEGFVWPPANVLRTVKDFDSFSMRWQTVEARS